MRKAPGAELGAFSPWVLPRGFLQFVLTKQRIGKRIPKPFRRPLGQSHYEIVVCIVLGNLTACRPLPYRVSRPTGRRTMKVDAVHLDINELAGCVLARHPCWRHGHSLGERGGRYELYKMGLMGVSPGQAGP